MLNDKTPSFGALRRSLQARDLELVNIVPLAASSARFECPTGAVKGWVESGSCDAVASSDVTGRYLAQGYDATQESAPWRVSLIVSISAKQRASLACSISSIPDFSQSYYDLTHHG